MEFVQACANFNGLCRWTPDIESLKIHERTPMTALSLPKQHTRVRVQLRWIANRLLEPPHSSCSCWPTEEPKAQRRRPSRCSNCRLSIARPARCRCTQLKIIFGAYYWYCDKHRQSHGGKRATFSFFPNLVFCWEKKPASFTGHFFAHLFCLSILFWLRMCLIKK